jgi:ankyrin repeat protein
MDRVRQLLHACEHGDGLSVQAFLDEGVGVDSTDDEETTPLQVNILFSCWPGNRTTVIVES